MPTLFSHPVAAWTLSRLLAGRTWSRHAATIAVCSCLPDLDVVAFALGIPDGDPLGHRGLTHSLPFALAVGLCAAALVGGKPRFTPAWWGSAGLFALATASHGVLDAATDGGLGVAFFAPFDNTRHFLPFRPLAVSPIGIIGFLTPRGFQVVESELIWIWLPSALLWGAALCAGWLAKGQRGGVGA